MSVPRRVLIGASAGTCLVLVKLIQANFYLGGDIAPAVALGGYLTAASFVALTVIFTCFLEEIEPRKLFMQALAAPGFLIALAQPGIGHAPAVINGGMQELNEIPILPTATLLFPLTAYAAEDPAGEAPKVQMLSPSSFDGTVVDGALRFVGRKGSATPYVYIVGKTSDEHNARRIASIYSNALADQQVHLLQPEGSDKIYVSVGDFGSAVEVVAKRRAISQDVAKLGAERLELKYLLPLIQGKVVNVRELSKTK